jgi:hypothetical protein
MDSYVDIFVGVSSKSALSGTIARCIVLKKIVGEKTSETGRKSRKRL